jgi:hypothetical protein
VIGLELSTTVYETTYMIDTNWHHYVVTKYSYGGGYAYDVYVDKVKYSATQNGGQAGDTNQALVIGDWYGGSQLWKGAIDEVMMFNRTLTSQEINDTFANQSARFVSMGQQEARFFNVSEGLGVANLSLQNYERRFGTNISARFGAWDLSLDYNTSDMNSTANGLVAYYNFDNRSSLGENQTLLVDRVGNANGTCSGTACPPLGSGTFNHSRNFDGVNDLFTLENPSRLNTTAAYTIALLF